MIQVRYDYNEFQFELNYFYYLSSRCQQPVLLFVNKCLLYAPFKLEKYFNTHQKLFGSIITEDTLKKTNISFDKHGGTVAGH